MVQEKVTGRKNLQWEKESMTVTERGRGGPPRQGQAGTRCQAEWEAARFSGKRGGVDKPGTERSRSARGSPGGLVTVTPIVTRPWSIRNHVMGELTPPATVTARRTAPKGTFSMWFLKPVIFKAAENGIAPVVWETE